MKTLYYLIGVSGSCYISYEVDNIDIINRHNDIQIWEYIRIPMRKKSEEYYKNWLVDIFDDSILVNIGTQ